VGRLVCAKSNGPGSIRTDPVANRARTGERERRRGEELGDETGLNSVDGSER
jgi:hypothetical protein